MSDLAGNIEFIRTAVQNRIGKSLMEKILRECVFSDKKLWAHTKPRGFKKGCLLLTLYKDLTGVGYLDLRKDIAKWCVFSNESIQHNVKVCRLVLRNWAKGIVIPQAEKRLAAIARKTERPGKLSDVVLWVDSSDFRMKGKKASLRDRTYWSKKESSPARRFVTITNSKGQTQWISPPYPPTTYDSDILIHCGLEIDRLFPKCHMVGDNHFRKAASLLKSVVLHTNISKAGRPKVVDGKKVPHALKPEEEQWNKDVSLVRGKIEAPYGWVKSTFTSLSKPFYEDEDQMDCIVWTAFGVHRKMLDKEE